ncbi:MAG TPA: SDR family oxidoreductase [Pseudonocardiaceae bacterium]|nr:SDR family oxidoreductase [Pseudonocardiaceae bacterium]
MTILVTGATGNLGALAVEHLLQRVPASELAVSVRDPGKAAGLAERGVDVRHGDFDEPDTLREAFAGVDKLLLVSTSGPDELRVGQHANAVRAAKEAGIRFIAYTSVTDADTSPVGLAVVHKATEEGIRESGIPFAFLRNGMYHENYTPQLSGAYERGALMTATGDGRIASVSREDLALAAAVVMTGDGYENTVHELTGPRAWNFDELAAIATEVTGKPLSHKSVPGPELVAALTGAGLPGFLAELFVNIDENIQDGVFTEVRPDLDRLIGRPATTIEDAVRAAFA